MPTIVPGSQPGGFASYGERAGFSSNRGAPPAPGDTLRYTLRYENTGNTTITGGMLIDDFDETLVGMPTKISDGGIVDGNFIRWELEDILPGTSGLVSYEVTINSGANFPPGSAYVFNTAILNADQAAAAGTSELTVRNNAPIISSLEVDEMLDENGEVTLVGTFSDASSPDTHTITIDWGDDQSDTLTLSNGERSFSISHAFGSTHPPQLENYTIAVSISDADGQIASRSVVTNIPDVAVDVVVTLPTGTSNRVVVRKIGDNVEVIDQNTAVVLSSTALANTRSLRIIGSDTDADEVWLDYSLAAGGFFTLPEGIDVFGGSGSGDSLTVTGTGSTDAVYSTTISPAGQTQLTVTEGSLNNTISYSDYDNLTFDGMLSFAAVGTLSVGSGNLTIGSTGPVDLGSLTLISGGVFTSSSAIVLNAGEELIGFGTLNFPDDESVFSMVNGSISGTSSDEPITLNGFFKGVGPLDHVVIAGTYSPGFSPATVNLGSVTYTAAATVEVEIGGLQAGEEHDQLIHGGAAQLAGTLDIQFLDEFQPAFGHAFDVMTFPAGYTGTFEFAGLQFTTVTENDTVLVPQYQNDRLRLVTTGMGDANLDGTVDFLDFLDLQNNFGGSGGWAEGDFDFSGTIDFLDFLILQNHYTNSYFGAPTPRFDDWGADTSNVGAYLEPKATGGRDGIESEIGATDRQLPEKWMLPIAPTFELTSLLRDDETTKHRRSVVEVAADPFEDETRWW